MRTETKTYNVYTFDELSDEAKNNAHAEYLRKGNYWFCDREATNTMKEVEDLFHIKLNNWCIDTYRPEYPDVHFDEYWWEYSEKMDLKGNRARAFLWNNFGHVILESRHHYYYKDASGKYRNGVADNSVKYVSKMSFDRVYDGTCPLTGVYFDCCALEPLAYFCFGVEWNEKEKRRTMTTDRLIAHDDQTTVEDVIRDCVRSMFKSFIDDVEDAESIERFAEDCEANGWEFLEDGTMV